MISFKMTKLFNFSLNYADHPRQKKNPRKSDLIQLNLESTSLYQGMLNRIHIQKHLNTSNVVSLTLKDCQ